MSGIDSEAVIEARYWVPTPDLFQEASDQLVENYRGRIERYELCRNYLNQPVYGFRFGRGARNVVFLGTVHGHEPAGTCGLLALMDGLLGGTVPGSDSPYEPASALLEEFSIDCVPMANPDAAQRYASQVPDSYLALTFRHTEEDSERFVRIIQEPGIAFQRPRPPHFTPREVMEWRQTGKPMGSLFTEEGVELWKDWAHGRSPQIVAMRELLRLRRPELFVDVHQTEVANCIFVPSGLRSDADEARHARLAHAAYDDLERTGIPFTREVVPYIRARLDLDNATNWAYMNLGCLQFLLEVDSSFRLRRPGVEAAKGSEQTPLTKAQIVMSVWQILTSFLRALTSQNR